ncbi:putative ABC transporter domain-containing protein [Gammaproteobacteria bacterium]
MEPLLQVQRLNIDGHILPSFMIMQGEGCVLRLPDDLPPVRIADHLLGRYLLPPGAVLFGGRELNLTRRRGIAWIPAGGGLISNLPIWENIALPLWYHDEALQTDIEDRLAFWLEAVGLERKHWPNFLAAEPDELEELEIRQAGLVRGLLSRSNLLLVDGGLFAGIGARWQPVWEGVLQNYLEQDKDRGVLIITEGTVGLPWPVAAVIGAGTRGGAA